MELELDLDTTSQEQEQSTLEWARAQGACVDYETELFYNGKFQAPSDDEYDQQLHDPSDAIIIATITALFMERLTVNKDAALLLKAAHSFREVPTTQSSDIGSRIWIRDLKQELPVLPSDHEYDLVNFGNIAVPDFQNLQLPSEVSADQNNEGFQWPTEYSAYPAQFDAQIKAEKLAVTREVLVYLQEAIRDAYVTEDGEKIEAESNIRKQKPIVRPATPPLLPLSPPMTPYIPSSPANHLPLVSDDSDSVVVEAQALHDQIMAADSLLRKDSDSSDSMLLDVTHPPTSSPLFEISTLPILKRRAEDLKVEGPLTPPMFSTSPMKKLKSVSFADTLHEYISYEPWSQDLVAGEGNISSVESDHFFEEVEALAEQARKKVDREQLSGADTIARVDVPDVDFSLPIAPWNEYSQRKGNKHRLCDTELQAQMNFILRVKREDLKLANSWHGLSIPERELKWSFLNTRVSALSLEEKLHGESETTKIIAEIARGDIATSSAQVWKREGLRILDEDEDEEELDPDGDEERQDMEALIRKRKLEMEEEVNEKHRKRTSSQQAVRSQIQSFREMQQRDHFGGRGPVQISTTRSKTMNHATQRVQPPKNTSGDLMFGGFSASTALHKFMETRGKPVEPAKTSTREAPDSKRRCQSDTRIAPVGSRSSSSHQSAIQDQHVQTASKTLPMLPSVRSNLAPCSFVISSTFLQQRGILKQIDELYPNAEMVYRDYTLSHSVAEEADIILSPSTGLIFTTLQKVKQRSLPGQPDRSPVEERMIMLQLRYERLVVLVSEGLSREMEELGSGRPDDPRDTEALRALGEFASKLEGDVAVRYVRGGEKALARSTVAEMADYGLPHGSVDIGDIKPMAQETSWEILLRRVGFNPFAAQAIVAWLQKPLDVLVAPSSAPRVPTHHAKTVLAVGLPRFILMGEDERIHSFQALMGGSRVLMRASKLMDQEWVSAVHGFRM